MAQNTNQIAYDSVYVNIPLFKFGMQLRGFKTPAHLAVVAGVAEKTARDFLSGRQLPRLETLGRMNEPIGVIWKCLFDEDVRTEPQFRRAIRSINPKSSAARAGRERGLS